MGYSCDKDWYFSNIIVGQEHYKPMCTGIDKNHSEKLKISALQIHMEDFVKVNSTVLDNDKDRWCNYPILVFKESHEFFKKKPEYYGTVLSQTSDFWTGPGQEDFVDGHGDKKRIVRKRRTDTSPIHEFRHLVSSPHDTHSAQKLCESEISRGPDFVSHSEGLFCDMQGRSLWTLYDEKRGFQKDCYHWDTHSLATGTERMAKNYIHVDEWD